MRMRDNMCRWMSMSIDDKLNVYNSFIQQVVADKKTVDGCKIMD